MQMDKSRAIILIGMPGAGKSTIGPLLSEVKGMSYVDTDTLLSEREGMSPAEIVKVYGRDYFMKVQDEIVLLLHTDGYVVATGGSVVCSSICMCKLKTDAIVVYLMYSIEEIESRFSVGRQLARKNGETFRDMWTEREPLYEKYADLTVECTGLSPERIVKDIVDGISLLY